MYLHQFNGHRKPERMKLFSSKLEYILNLFFLATLIKGRTVHRSEDGFSHTVETLLDELSRRYSMGDTIKKAREKLQETRFETWNETTKSAALIINIFTSSDIISVEHKMTFYGILQKQLRSDRIDDLWKRCEDLLNDALHIIGFEIFDHLYRGEWEWSALFPDEGQTYFVRSFWSTTLDPLITRYFGGEKDFFYHILGAKGVRVDNISVSSEEKEILLPSARSYRVVRILRDATEIIKVLKTIGKQNSGADLTTLNPKVLIVLADENIYTGMKFSTEATIPYISTESKTKVASPEKSRGHMSSKEFKTALYLAFCIHVFNKATMFIRV